MTKYKVCFPLLVLSAALLTACGSKTAPEPETKPAGSTGQTRHAEITVKDYGITD